ncbi:MAG TPA: isoprenylcysteine carboxylmethyltransferase family protein [Anaerolineales bacterium]|nr:isoprenylcysteine carboxylmethyltransferase family protein [Anaerolineales bacterium]
MTRSKPLLSYGLVAIQLLSLGLIALSGPLFAANPALLMLEGAAGLLGLWAIGTMGVGNFNVTPDVKHQARLVTGGPYRHIRHPMYTALLMGSLSLVLDAFSLLRLAMWLVLLVDLLVKLNYEERLLRRDLEGYSTHMQRTRRLIPFLY